MFYILFLSNAIPVIYPEAIKATRQVAVSSQFVDFDDTVELGVEQRKKTDSNVEYNHSGR